MLTAEQKEALRKQLLGIREALENRSQANAEDAQPVSLDQPIGRLTRMDAMQQQQMALSQQQRVAQELQQVEAALGRLDRQRYGMCLRCQEIIPYERLVLRPAVTLCYDCQCELETRRGKG